MPSDAPKSITTPEILLYGPDTKHDAIAKKKFKSYVYYLVWYEDGQKRERSTGARFPEKAQAEGALEEWLREQREARTAAAPAGGYRPHEVKVGWILAQYSEAKSGAVSSTDTLTYSVEGLWPFWNDRLLSEVGRPTCEDYVKWRTAQPTKQSLTAREKWERLVAEAPAFVPPPAWSAWGGGDPAARKERKALKAKYWRRRAAIERLPKDQQEAALQALGDPPWDAKRSRKKPRIIGPQPELEMVSTSTARRELGALAAAISYAREMLWITETAPVTLPPEGEPREAWLTRTQAARLLLAARQKVPGMDLDFRRHLVVFIKTAIYHGARSSAMLELPLVQPFDGGGWINIERDTIDFGPGNGRKGRPRKVKLHPRIKVYVRGAIRRGQRNLIERMKPRVVQTESGPTTVYDSVPVKDISSSFSTCVKRAGLPENITPHILRHTAVSWLVQARENKIDVGRYVAMSAKMVDDTYGHHDPEHQSSIIAATTSRRRG